MDLVIIAIKGHRVLGMTVEDGSWDHSASSKKRDGSARVAGTGTDKKGRGTSFLACSRGTAALLMSAVYRGAPEHAPSEGRVFTEYIKGSDGGRPVHSDGAATRNTYGAVEGASSSTKRWQASTDPMPVQVHTR